MLVQSLCTILMLPNTSLAWDMCFTIALGVCCTLEGLLSSELYTHGTAVLPASLLFSVLISDNINLSVLVNTQLLLGVQYIYCTLQLHLGPHKYLPYCWPYCWDSLLANTRLSCHFCLVNTLSYMLWTYLGLLQSFFWLITALMMFFPSY